jgi:hypothetical protein
MKRNLLYTFILPAINDDEGFAFDRHEYDVKKSGPETSAGRHGLRGNRIDSNYYSRQYLVPLKIEGICILHPTMYSNKSLQGFYSPSIKSDFTIPGKKKAAPHYP